MKSKGKQERSRQTISTILRAAVEVLIDEGFERATTNRIAERAGYSVGTLYHYFNDKEDIYAEIIDQLMQQLNDSTSNCAIQPTLIQTLETWLTLLLAALDQDPATIQALEALLAGQFRVKRQAAYHDLVASTVQLLEAHRDEIVVEDLELAAGIIVGATAGLATSENAMMLVSPKVIQHILRLQFAYLTLDT